MAHQVDDLVVAAPLLQTKLFPPRWRTGHVSRPVLVDRLHTGLARPVSLVSAPAGFGKTTLLAEWLASDRMDASLVGWLSLDEGDNDPARFWAYVIAALRAAGAEIDERADTLMRSHDSPPIEAILTIVINDLSASERERVLVLDDLHAIDSAAITHALAFLLDHLPPSLRLIMASRSDPPLPLARLRGRGALSEIRLADLRFTEGEAGALLNDAMGLSLPPESVAALERRTEGWAAGLQLAALSLQGHSDPGAFVAEFAGDDRYVVDYLVDEVLRRQPESVRRFLLETSVLDRLNAQLCDAVTGRDDARVHLDALDRGNLFVVPLDDKRQWYRYHHLFGGVLRKYLHDECAELEPVLRRRAAAWFERGVMITDAIECASGAADHETVARLLIEHAGYFERIGHSTSVSRWCAALPESIVRANPRLALIQAAAATELEPNFDLARRLLGWAESAIQELEGGSPDEITPEALAALKADAIVLRLIAVRGQSPDEITADAKYALSMLPAEKHYARSGLHQLLAAIHREAGRPEDAFAELESSAFEARLSGSVMALGCALTGLGDYFAAAGRLSEGRRVAEEAIVVAGQIDFESDWSLSRTHAYLAEVLLELDELDVAVRHIERALSLTESGPPRSFVLYSRTIAALIFVATGDRERALACLESARAFAAAARKFRYASVLGAAELRVFCGLDDLDSAAATVGARNLTPGMAVTDDNEEEVTAYCRYLLLAGQPAAAAAVLDRVLPIVRERRRVHHEIHALALFAAACERLGRRVEAIRALGRATALGEHGPFVRTFTHDTPGLDVVFDALQSALRRGEAPPECGSAAYLARLSDAPLGSSRPATASLPEALTEREAEIMRLIAAGMKNQEIADTLFISVATVKRHIANAYGKLGVSYRTEAVARVSELNLI